MFIPSHVNRGYQEAHSEEPFPNVVVTKRIGNRHVPYHFEDCLALSSLSQGETSHSTQGSLTGRVSYEFPAQGVLETTSTFLRPDEGIGAAFAEVRNQQRVGIPQAEMPPESGYLSEEQEQQAKITKFLAWTSNKPPVDTSAPPSENEMKELAHVADYVTQEDATLEFGVDRDSVYFKAFIELMNIHLMPNRIFGEMKFYTYKRIKDILSRKQGPRTRLPERDYIFFSNYERFRIFFSVYDGSITPENQRAKKIDLFNRWTWNRLALDEDSVSESGEPPTDAEMINAAHVAGFMTIDDVISLYEGSSNENIKNFVRRNLKSHRKFHEIDFFEGLRVKNIYERMKSQVDGPFLFNTDFDFFLNRKELGFGQKDAASLNQMEPLPSSAAEQTS